VLVRHVLRYEQEKAGGGSGVELGLSVPRSASWPDAAQWALYGCEARPSGEDTYLVTAQPWTPSWLSEAESYPPAAAAFAEKNRRDLAERPGDPFLVEMGEKYQNYRSLGQKAAVRSVLEAPDGATLVVNLPTGAGKSLCGHLPVELDKGKDRLTVVVVPTVALALDQRDSIQHVVGHETAYYSGNPANEEIKRRIRSGDQRIVFTSPEGLLSGLTPAVFRAAQEGFLRHLIIDEAHIVDQWGTDFRSSFQDLAGMRQGLLDVCDVPFTTLLFSATFTEGTLRTLQSLFGRPGPFEHVSAVRVRPEPSYWWATTDDRDERERRVLEALRHLPRPAILYASERTDVRDWHDLLKQKGYRRLDMMTGDSSPDERQRVLDRWREDEIDLVVATSAFGLGIDKRDVRAVMHACIPEDINRFYQEVGRGGRDGRASVSLLLAYRNPSDRDEKGRRNDDDGCAWALNQQRVLTVERAFERWEEMFRSEQTTRIPERSRRHYRVPIRAYPGLDSDNEMNEAWNIRTLLLMHRSGLIDLQGEPPPTKEEVPEDEMEDRLQQYFDKRVIEVKMAAPLNKDAFQDAIRPVRETMQADTEQGLVDMMTLLEGRQCAAEVLARVYRVPRDGPMDEAPVTRSVSVLPECGGCPACRDDGSQPGVSPSEEVSVPPWSAGVDDMHASLRSFFREGRQFYVFYDAEDQGRTWFRTLETAVRHCVQRGVRRVIAPREVLDKWRDRWRDRSLQVFLDELETDWPDPAATLSVPELVYLPSGTPLPANYVRGDSPRILIVPASTAHPRDSRRRLQDVCTSGYVSFPEFQSQIAL
jgi:superfamily II DNA/RNA helicase